MLMEINPTRVQNFTLKYTLYKELANKWQNVEE